MGRLEGLDKLKPSGLQHSASTTIPSAPGYWVPGHWQAPFTKKYRRYYWQHTNESNVKAGSVFRTQCVNLPSTGAQRSHSRANQLSHKHELQSWELDHTFFITSSVTVFHRLFLGNSSFSCTYRTLTVVNFCIWLLMMNKLAEIMDPLIFIRQMLGSTWRGHRLSWQKRFSGFPHVFNAIARMSFCPSSIVYNSK
jgi:hypothetical protein